MDSKNVLFWLTVFTTVSGWFFGFLCWWRGRRKWELMGLQIEELRKKQAEMTREEAKQVGEGLHALEKQVEAKRFGAAVTIVIAGSIFSLCWAAIATLQTARFDDRFDQLAESVAAWQELERERHQSLGGKQYVFAVDGKSPFGTDVYSWLKPTKGDRVSLGLDLLSEERFIKLTKQFAGGVSVDEVAKELEKEGIELDAEIRAGLSKLRTKSVLSSYQNLLKDAQAYQGLPEGQLLQGPWNDIKEKQPDSGEE